MENNLIKCDFCDILCGGTERKPIFENDVLAVIVPRNQKTPGHVMVVPKAHYEDIFQLPNEILSQISLQVKIESQRLMKDVKATGVSVINMNGYDAGQRVPHFHIHVIPRHSDDGLALSLKKKE